MTLYKNKYRIESTRLKGWDYSSPGTYFITICTKNRECLFGEIVDGEMVLSEMGKIVKSEWLKSFEIRSELSCDEYCIMPNHIHGIVIINETDRIGNIRRDARPCVSTDIATGNTDNTDIAGNTDNTDIAGNTDNTDIAGNTGINIKRLPRSISSFVAGFKSSATKSINQLRHTPGIPVWQPRFHDHIIRDENALNRIRQYIISNPRNWNNDKNFLREGKS